MNCPICKNPMKKISWHVTNNRKKGANYKEYNKTLYQCEKDDAWVDTEIPKMKLP